MMKYYVIILLLLFQCGGWVPWVRASEADLEWQEAIGSVKAGESDFALMDFRTLLNDYPNSRYSPTAAFAMGEYYFLHDDLPAALDEFKNFYAKYPQNQQAPIALAYLFKIAQTEKMPAAMKEYRKKMASFRQLTFIFSQQKSYQFLSGFQRHYKLVYFIDKVRLYVNGQLFAEIPF